MLVQSLTEIHILKTNYCLVYVDISLLILKYCFKFQNAHDDIIHIIIVVFINNMV